MESSIIVPLVIGCCIGGILIFFLFIAVFGALGTFINWVSNGIVSLIDGFFSMTDEIIVDVSNSINSLTDKQKEEIKNIAVTSLYTVTALMLYMQEDETGKSKKASEMIIDSIAHNTPDTTSTKKEPHAKDSQIKELAKTEVINERQTQSTYSKGEQEKFRVFLCHAKEDAHIAREFRNTLVRYNYEVWLDESSLLPGHEWEREIQKAIRSSDVFLLCLSSSWGKRKGYIHAELRLALDEAKKMPPGSIFIIPTRFENCVVPDELEKIQWIDLFTDSRNNFTKLIKSLDLVKTTKMQYH